jgi:hypothetical protein
MNVAAFVPNLMDRSRFSVGTTRFIASADELAAEDLVIVDLDRCEDPGAFRVDGPRVIGFGSHVDVASAQAAEAAGYDEVLPRSVFFRRLPEILAVPNGG